MTIAFQFGNKKMKKKQAVTKQEQEESGKWLKRTIVAGMLTKSVISTMYNGAKTLKNDLRSDKKDAVLFSSTISEKEGGEANLHCASKNNSLSLFSDIVGYEKLKTIFYRAIESTEPVHILLVGPPGIGKTMFLSAVEQKFKTETLLRHGEKLSGPGLVDELFEHKPKYICIDEIGLLDEKGQNSLLNLMETGRTIEAFKNRKRELELHPWVFATSNNDGDLVEPLKSRFMIFYLKGYNYEQFCAVAKGKLVGTDSMLVDAICNAVWNKQNSHDPRDVIKLARTCRTIDELNETMDAILEYKK